MDIIVYGSTGLICLIFILVLSINMFLKDDYVEELLEEEQIIDNTNKNKDKEEN